MWGLQGFFRKKEGFWKIIVKVEVLKVIETYGQHPTKIYIYIL